MKLSLLTVLAVFLLAAPAQADWKNDRALAIANTVWGSPCDGNVQIQFTSFVEEDVNGRWDPAAPCTLQVLDDFGFGDPKVPWEPMCTVVLHEMGHAAGYRDPTNTADPMHSSDPNDLMTAHDMIAQWDVEGKIAWGGTDRRCRDRGRPFLERHGLLAPISHSRPRSGSARRQFLGTVGRRVVAAGRPPH